MLKTIGVTSIDELIDKTIPADIRLANNLNLPKAMSEYEYMFHIQELATKNKLFYWISIILNNLVLILLSSEPLVNKTQFLKSGQLIL